MNNALNAYQKQAVLNATPEELISLVYDGTIAATYRKDQPKLLEGLQILIHALNFDYEPAQNFYNVYQYCRFKGQQNEFEEVREILGGIRDAWNENVLNRKK